MEIKTERQIFLQNLNPDEATKLYSKDFQLKVNKLTKKWIPLEEFIEYLDGTPRMALFEKIEELKKKLKEKKS